MGISEIILLGVLILLVVLIAALPVLIVRARRSTRSVQSTAPTATTPVQQTPTEPVNVGPLVNIPPEEISGQTGGALMQDYSALQSEYRPVTGAQDQPPAPRKNGKSH